MLEKIKETANFLRARVTEIPDLAIILGTGLGDLVDHIEEKIYILSLIHISEPTRPY